MLHWFIIIYTEYSPILLTCLHLIYPNSSWETSQTYALSASFWPCSCNRFLSVCLFECSSKDNGLFDSLGQTVVRAGLEKMSKRGVIQSRLAVVFFVLCTLPSDHRSCFVEEQVLKLGVHLSCHLSKSFKATQQVAEWQLQLPVTTSIKTRARSSPNTVVKWSQ